MKNDEVTNLKSHHLMHEKYIILKIQMFNNKKYNFSVHLIQFYKLNRKKFKVFSISDHWFSFDSIIFQYRYNCLDQYI